MSDLKHTPGPWRVGKTGCVVSDSDKNITIGGAIGKEAIDYFGGNLICESVMPSNAKLIAAAPELLEALQEIIPFNLEWINENHPTYKKAISAIKKALE